MRGCLTEIGLVWRERELSRGIWQTSKSPSIGKWRKTCESEQCETAGNIFSASSALQPVRIFSRRKELHCPPPSHECRHSLRDPPTPPYEGGESLAKSSARWGYGAFDSRSVLSQTVQRFFPPFVWGGQGGSRRACRGFPGTEVDVGPFDCGRMPRQVDTVRAGPRGILFRICNCQCVRYNRPKWTARDPV